MAAKPTIEAFTAAVARALGGRLSALLLYGSVARGTPAPRRSDVNTLLICDAVDGAVFAALDPAVRDWVRAGHPAPLLFSEREWREWADAFPIEYEDIREAHRLLAGRDPWAGITVPRAALRRQLEHELRGKLVRLRQAYVALRGDRRRLARVLGASASGFFTMLRATLRLAGQTPPAAAPALVGAASAVIGFAPQGLAPLVRHATEGSALRLAARDPLPDAYLAAVARTADFVHQLA